MTLHDPAGLDAEDAPPEVVIGDDRDPDERAIDQRVTKRIGKLVRRRHAAERRADDAEERARRAEALLAQAQRSTIDFAAHATASDLSTAEREAKAAFEAGDADAHVAAQRKLAEAVARQRDIDGRRANAPPEPPPQQQQQITEKTRQWIADNPWFDTDKGMRAAALRVHEDLMHRGVDPDSDVYFDTLTRRMQAAFPDIVGDDDDAADIDLDDEPPPPPPRRAARPVPAVAPANRAPPAAQARSTVVRLTQDEADIARSMGMTPIAYAQEKEKLRKAGRIK